MFAAAGFRSVARASQLNTTEKNGKRRKGLPTWILSKGRGRGRIRRCCREAQQE
jgi:hypothetical protein